MDLTREVREIASQGEWLQWRVGLVTASHTGCLFGCHPHVTLDDLIAEKRGERRGEGDNASMRAGRILEPAVIAALNEERPELHVVKATTFHILPELRLACTPDAFGDDDLLVQCKTVSPAQWDRWHGKAPLHYVLQTLCELLVTGRTRGILACMIRSPSYPLFLFDVARHPAAEQRILDAVAEFWRKWDAGDHPVPHSSDGLSEIVADDGSHKDLVADLDLPPLLDEREQLKLAIGIEEKRCAEIDAVLKARIGKARTAFVPGWTSSYQTTHRAAVTIPEKNIRTLRVRRLRWEGATDEQ